MSERHDDQCPDDLVAHIADIEAGWTLRKPWKAIDEDAAERENREEVSAMLKRWRQHGIRVVEVVEMPVARLGRAGMRPTTRPPPPPPPPPKR